MTEPRQRITLKPGELVGLAGLIALFIGLITLMVTEMSTQSQAVPSSASLTR